MTPKMRELLDYIKAYIEEHGYSPTYGEMCEATGNKSKSRIFGLIDCLEERGYIERIPMKARSIKVFEDVDQSQLEKAYDFIEKHGLLKEFENYLEAA